MGADASQNRCIYYKDRKDLRFEKQEHIFPAFMGGMKMLDRGVVSDQANELFSGIEKHVSMESIINLNRMFYGPGKRGSKNPGKAGSAKISVMRSPEGRTSLGYVVMGKPKQITQCCFDVDADNNMFEMVLDAEQKDHIDVCVEKFFEDIKKMDLEKVVFILDQSIPEQRIILGIHKGKWFLGCHPALEKKMVKQAVASFIRKCTTQEFRKEEGKIVKENMECRISYGQNMKKYSCFCAKIAFNVSAYLNGKEFMLQDCFDGIREAIISGENIIQYVKMPEENPLKVFDEHLYTAIYGKHLHSVVCVRRGSEYYAIVSFYGFVSCMVVKFTEDLKVHPTTMINGFFCDWENRKEYDLENFLAGLGED